MTNTSLSGACCHTFGLRGALPGLYSEQAYVLLIQLPCTLTLHSTEQHIPLLLCVILSTSASHHNISSGSESTVFSFKFRILDPKLYTLDTMK